MNTYIKLILAYLKIGLFGFGGGYAMLSLIQREVVGAGWITNTMFTDIVAISQMTPGPIGVNAATYIGYKTHDIIGGIVATAGLLTPAVFLVILAAFYFKKWEKSPVVQGLLSGMRPAALGLIASAVLAFANICIFRTPVTVQTVQAWFGSGDAPAFGIRFLPLIFAAASALTLHRFKVNIIYIIAAAALLGAFFIR
jgi:chromate transporter